VQGDGGRRLLTIGSVAPRRDRAQRARAIPSICCGCFRYILSIGALIIALRLVDTTLGLSALLRFRREAARLSLVPLAPVAL